jgi:ribonuclease J
MSFSGHIAVSILLDHRGDLEQDPQFALTGVPERDPAGNPMARIVAGAIRGAVVSIPRPRRRDTETVGDAVRRSVRAAVAEVWGKKPVCTVLVSVIE